MSLSHCPGVYIGENAFPNLLNRASQLCSQGSDVVFWYSTAAAQGEPSKILVEVLPASTCMLFDKSFHRSGVKCGGEG